MLSYFCVSPLIFILHQLILVSTMREDILNDAAILITAENTASYTIHQGRQTRSSSPVLAGPIPAKHETPYCYYNYSIQGKVLLLIKISHTPHEYN